SLSRQCWLAVVVRFAQRARARSLLGGMQRVGSCIGPFVGAGAQSLMGIQGAFAVGAVCMGLAVIITFWIQELEEPATAPPAEPPTTGPIVIITNPAMIS